jgi:hypothetical protein
MPAGKLVRCVIAQNACMKEKIPHLSEWGSAWMKNERSTWGGHIISPVDVQVAMHANAPAQ